MGKFIKLVERQIAHNVDTNTTTMTRLIFSPYIIASYLNFRGKHCIINPSFCDADTSSSCVPGKNAQTVKFGQYASIIIMLACFLLVALCFFRVSGPVLWRNRIFVWFFRGGGGSGPLSPSGSWYNYNLEEQIHSNNGYQRVLHVCYPTRHNWAVACYFQQCGILTSVDSDEPVQPPFKLRNSKWCSVSSLTVTDYSSD